MKDNIKMQIKIILIQIGITIIYLLLLFNILFTLNLPQNLFTIIVECLLFPGALIYDGLFYFKEGFFKAIISIIGNHLIYCFYLHFAKKSKIIAYFMLLIVFCWILYYIYLKIIF